jgi:L-ribulokinase
MGADKYTIGVDYGTESGRAVLVDVATGEEVASAVHPYSDGVIDTHLPGSDTPLPPDFALQNPQDYIAVLQETIPAVLRKSGVVPEDIIGIGTDFTACTMLPIDATRCLSGERIPTPGSRFGNTTPLSQKRTS